MKTRFLFPVLAVLAACISCKQENKAAGFFMEKCMKPVAEGTDLACLEQQFNTNRAEWEAAVEFLSRTDLDTLSLGRYQLTEKTYANIQEYVPSMNQGRFEAHRGYIDIQYAISGEELVYVAGLADAREVSVPYSETNDCEFYNLAISSRPLTICPDQYVILFPSDAHMPGRPACDNPTTIRKVVVKIPFSK